MLKRWGAHTRVGITRSGLDQKSAQSKKLVAAMEKRRCKEKIEDGSNGEYTYGDGSCWGSVQYRYGSSLSSRLLIPQEHVLAKELDENPNEVDVGPRKYHSSSTT